MNVKALKEKYAGRIAKAEDDCQRKADQVHREICREYGWPNDAFVFVSRTMGDVKEIGKLPKWEYKYSISWTVGGDCVLKPIAKSLGKLLVDMGFPSGS